MNNFMFETKTILTYEDILDRIISETGGAMLPPARRSNDIIEILYVCGLIFSTGDRQNPYGFKFLVKEDEFFEPTELMFDLYNKIYLRYKDHFACSIDKDNDFERLNASIKFLKKLFLVIDFTYDKYSKLLSLYDGEKDKLLDKLSRVRSGSREIASSGENENNGFSLFNDTPQNTDVVADIEGDQYVSNLSKDKTTGSSSSEGTDEFEETETYDTMTIMSKLEEIEKYYSMIWLKWLNEFDRLFIEEANF